MNAATPTPTPTHLPPAVHPGDAWIAISSLPNVGRQRTEIGVVLPKPEWMSTFVLRERCWRTW